MPQPGGKREDRQPSQRMAAISPVSNQQHDRAGQHRWPSLPHRRPRAAGAGSVSECKGRQTRSLKHRNDRSISHSGSDVSLLAGRFLSRQLLNARLVLMRGRITAAAVMLRQAVAGIDFIVVMAFFRGLIVVPMMVSMTVIELREMRNTAALAKIAPLQAEHLGAQHRQHGDGCDSEFVGRLDHRRNSRGRGGPWQVSGCRMAGAWHGAVLRIPARISGGCIDRLLEPAHGRGFFAFFFT